MIGNDFVLTAERNKPLLHVWPVNSQEQIKNFRMILPEPANCVAVSPNNSYLAVGIGAKLYIWQIESGKLLRVQQKHYQPVSCVKFSSDGDFVVVGGEDGILVVYNFGDLVNLHGNVLAQSEAGQVEPLYKKMDHTMAVSDVFIGSFGYKSRFVTVSPDHTCRLYSLLRGDLLLCLFFDEALTAAVFDGPCWNMYIGSASGKVYGFNLKSPPRNIEYHVNNDSKTPVFLGHERKITCLDLNMAGKILASGSEDSKVFIWDTESLQMLRQLELKSSITNLRFVLSSEKMFAQHFKPSIVLKSLERSLNPNNNFTVAVIQNEDISFSDEEEIEKSHHRPERLDSLETELETVKVINHQLYEYMLKLTNKLNKR